VNTRVGVKTWALEGTKLDITTITFALGRKNKFTEKLAFPELWGVKRPGVTEDTLMPVYAVRP